MSEIIDSEYIDVEIIPEIPYLEGRLKNDGNIFRIYYDSMFVEFYTPEKKYIEINYFGVSIFELAEIVRIGKIYRNKRIYYLEHQNECQ